VRRPKAAPVAAPRARGRRRIDQLGGEINSKLIPDPLVMQSMYVGATCTGFLYSRGRQGVEAYDADMHSLGIFPDKKAAADAVAQMVGENDD
jgi:hypothetical protein